MHLDKKIAVHFSNNGRQINKYEYLFVFNSIIKKEGVYMQTQLDSYVSAETLAKSLGLSKIGLIALSRKGQFPPGVRIGHSRRWSVSEVKEWLNEQAQREVIA